MSREDLELGRLGPGGRRSSWIDKFSPNSLHGVGFHRSTTSRSKSSTSRTMTLNAPNFGYPAVLTIEESQQQDILIGLIVGDQIVKETLASSCNWYGRYLQSKFKSHWHLLAAALVGLEDRSTAPKTGNLVVVYKFVIAVARFLHTRKDVALVEIVDALDNENMLKPQLDEERAIPNQIVFTTLGWLTMFYEAVTHPKPDKLEVTRTSTNSFGRSNLLETRKYCTFKQGFDHIDLPFYTLLGRFGDLIPEAKHYHILEPGYPDTRSSEAIMVQSVCFSTLQTLAELKIEWVTSLALHLEFDSGKKTLKLFQFPSFCRMMVVERDSNILSRLLNDYAARNCEDVREPDVPADEYFQEVLLTYRLIFGQDERSWRAFTRMVPVWEEQRGRSSWETSWDCDPMLHILCGRSASDEESQRIYEEIDANEPAGYYDPNTEFPFFRKRLIELQQFIRQHQPHNVRALLNDRRDVAAWWSLWNNQLLIFFTSVTIFLMVLGIGLQIWQVILAQQQLQGGKPFSRH